MKKALVVLVAVLAMSFGAFAANDNYEINDEAIENAFAEAVEVSADEINATGSMFVTNLGVETPNMVNLNAKSVNPWGAFALCWLLGEFGIHRHYMGTKPSMWAIYTFTCGGIFGIVPVVDWVVLLVGAIQDDISEYIDNDSFFMWL